MDSNERNYLRNQLRERDTRIVRLNDDREKLIDALHIFTKHNNKDCVVCEWLRKEIFT